MKFKTEITAIGKEAFALADAQKFIFFGEKASYGLEDYSIIINGPKEMIPIAVGDQITIGGVSYPITAVGEKVEETFSSLGHCTVCMDGADKAELPGTIHLKGDYPSFAVGDEIIFS